MRSYRRHVFQIIIIMKPILPLSSPWPKGLAHWDSKVLGSNPGEDVPFAYLYQCYKIDSLDEVFFLCTH